MQPIDESFSDACARLWSKRDAHAIVEGVPVSLRFAPAEARNSPALVATSLAHHTDLGMRVRLAGVLEANLGPFATGDDRFDGLFAVRAGVGDVPAMRQILDPRVRDEMCGLAALGEPQLTDDGVVVGIGTVGLSESEFAGVVRRAVDLTLHLSALAEHLPVTAALRSTGVAARVESFARDHRLAVKPNALSIRGALASTDIRAAFRAHTPHVPWCSIELRFHEPLGVGLALRAANLSDRAKEWVGRGDVHVGDDAFDDAWTIHANDEPGAQAILNADARRLLSRLGEAGLSFTLTDAGLEGTVAHEMTPDAVQSALQSCDALRDALRPRGALGPYRG